MSDEAPEAAGVPQSGPTPRDVSLERTLLIAGSVAPGTPGTPGQSAPGAAVAPRPPEPRAAWQRGQDALASIEREVAAVAAAMHKHVAALEPFVEGTFASDTTDPRTQLLVQALDVARSADRRLGRLDADIHRLRESAQVVGSEWDTVGAERERLATLYTIAQELNTSLDLDEVLGRVMALLTEVVRAERGAILLWDAPSASLRFVTGRDKAGSPVAEDALALSRGVVDQVWANRTPLLTTDAQSDDRLKQNYSVVSYGIRSVMCAPLLTRGRGVGVVYVDSRHEARLFDQSSLDLLAAFCNQAAIAIENARLVSDLRANIRELDAIKSFMENVFASIASGVMTTDIAGRVTTLNLAAERMLARPPAEIQGQPLVAALAPAGGAGAPVDESLASALRRAVSERAETLGYELTRDLSGRGEVSLRLNVTPLRGGAAQGEASPEPLGAALTLEDLTELRHSQRQAREIQHIFGRYVHPAVVRQLLADPSAAHLGGETREISVVFADIRNFSQIAERLAPDAVVSMLNHYLDLLTAAIWEEEGTLTMYIGDALMAIFNAPLPQPDHAARAVRAAWAMRQALEREEASGNTGGGARAQYGIGAHTGLALVGNIGAPGRMQNYTAIGDTVNIASRLQSSASANQILVSAETCAACGHISVARALEPLAVKGRSTPLQVFQLDGLRDLPGPEGADGA